MRPARPTQSATAAGIRLIRIGLYDCARFCCTSPTRKRGTLAYASGWCSRIAHNHIGRCESSESLQLLPIVLALPAALNAPDRFPLDSLACRRRLADLNTLRREHDAASLE